MECLTVATVSEKEYMDELYETLCCLKEVGMKIKWIKIEFGRGKVAILCVKYL